jgi:hypothetical protein
MSLTKEQDPEPDSFVRGTDPRIRICSKMSRIRNTGGGGGETIGRFSSRREILVLIFSSYAINISDIW